MRRASTGSGSSTNSTSSLPSLGEMPPIAVDYGEMKVDLIDILEKHEGSLRRMMTMYESMVQAVGMKKYKALMRNTYYTEIKSVQEFFRRVGKKWKPYDCSQLHALVKATKCDAAIERLERFESLSKQSEESLLVAKKQKLNEADPPSVGSPALPSHALGTPSSTVPHVGMEELVSSLQTVDTSTLDHGVQEELYSFQITATLAHEDLSVAAYDCKADAVCGALGLPRFALQPEEVEAGSVIIRWKTYSSVSHIQSHMIDECDFRLLLEEGITSVRVGSEFLIAVGCHDYWSDVSRDTISTYLIPTVHSSPIYACSCMSRSANYEISVMLI